MTPEEYRISYHKFMNDDEVYYISEHRGSYSNKKELKDLVYVEADYILCPISITRFASVEASLELLNLYNLKVAVLHIFEIKPLVLNINAIEIIKKSKFGMCVLDDDYVDGIAKSIALDLAHKTNVIPKTLGLKNKSAGFSSKHDNLPPNKDEIIKFVLEQCRE
jgi:transketolase C-terminal domain/subunit